jgi:mevalonate kinase
VFVATYVQYLLRSIFGFSFLNYIILTLKSQSLTLSIPILLSHLIISSSLSSLSLPLLSGATDSFDSLLDATELCVTASKGGFFSYIAGTAAVMTEHLSKPYNDAQNSYENEILEMSKNGSSHSTDNESKCNGIHIVNYKNDLPMGKGLSSSAAVCVLVAKCFNEVCDGDGNSV